MLDGVLLRRAYSFSGHQGHHNSLGPIGGELESLVLSFPRLSKVWPE